MKTMRLLVGLMALCVAGCETTNPTPTGMLVTPQGAETQSVTALAAERAAIRARVSSDARTTVWSSDVIEKSGGWRPFTIEAEKPARVTIVDYQRNFIPDLKDDKLDIPTRLKEAGETPVTIQIPRGDDFVGYAAVVEFTDGSAKLEFHPATLRNISKGKDKILIPAPDYGEPPDKEGAIATIKADLETRLIDPTSPLFRWGEFSRYIDLDSGPRYCWRLDFQLNSKNRLGGYTGWANGYATFERGRFLMAVVARARD